MLTRSTRAVLGALLLLCAALALGACGGSSSSEPKTAAAVRQDVLTAEQDVLKGDTAGCELLASAAKTKLVASVKAGASDPALAPYLSGVKDCPSAIKAAAKIFAATGSTQASLAALKQRVSSAKITVAGDHATYTAKGKTSGLSYQSGHWLVLDPEA
jgi:hypothetical protein